MSSNYDKQVDIGRKYFLRFDPSKIALKHGLKEDEEYLFLTYIGEKYRIHKETALVEKENTETSRETWSECRCYNAVMTIYDFLCHELDNPLVSLSGEWQLIGNFVISGASPSADTFSDQYARQFNEKTEKLKKACSMLGADLLPRLAGADVTARIPVFGNFAVLVQFWDGDDEFVPQIKLLWDKQTLHYLNFETTYYLQGDILDKLTEAMRISEQSLK